MFLKKKLTQKTDAMMLLGHAMMCFGANREFAISKYPFLIGSELIEFLYIEAYGQILFLQKLTDLVLPALTKID